MPSLNITAAVGNYDRTRPLIDGDVQIDGVNPVFLRLSPEEIFFRAFRHAEFDVCELSLSSYTVKVASGDCPYVGVPAFLSRAFRHTAVYIRTDKGIERPEDLKGRKLGITEYQLTANVWARAILEERHGVKPSDIHWIRGGMEELGRLEKVNLNLPSDVKMEPAPSDRTLVEMLRDGEIDGIMTPRPPSSFERGEPNIGWLFADPVAAARGYYEQTGIFPIMHLLGVRKTLVEQYPWLPATLLKAFTTAKDMAVERLAENSATKVTLPFVEEQVAENKARMGADYWSYGLDSNRAVLETFLKHHNRQGLSSRLVSPDELFYPTTHEVVKI